MLMSRLPMVWATVARVPGSFKARHRPLPICPLVFGGLRGAAGDAEHHAGDASHVEPALVRQGLYGDALVLVVRIDRAHDVDRRELSASDGCNGILHVLLAEAMEYGLQAFTGEDLAGPLKGPLEDAMAEAGILLADRHAGRPANGGARLAGDDDFFPGRRRHLHAGADDLDLVAIVEAGDERHDAAVDLGAHGGVADIGMNGIGEIDRRCAARQGDQLALGRETEDLVLEQLELRVLQKLLRIVAFRKRLDGMAEPGVSAGFLRQKLPALAAFAILVARCSP